MKVGCEGVLDSSACFEPRDKTDDGLLVSACHLAVVVNVRRLSWIEPLLRELCRGEWV